MTRLAELIDIPTHVHKSDFVISLETAIEEPERTLSEYVVTPQLVGCFDRALSLVTSAASGGHSKAAYLHASFGGGKTAMMAVLDLLLQAHPAARAVPELAPLVAEYAPHLDGRRFLLVPYRFVGRSSMEQEILGGYVSHVRTLHPTAPLPAVYVADTMLDDAVAKRVQLRDEVFFRVLSEGEPADVWGQYATGWDAARFEAAMAAGPGSAEREQLVGALLRTHYRALPGMAQATAEGFVPLDAGLNAISRHARSLGYDALVLLLDELVLWLASRMGEVAFVSREGNKIVHLVEGDAAQRPAPIASFIARQRDLRDLVSEHAFGQDALTAADVLRHAEGRFDTITLEDRNLPVIAERRLLRPRSEQARQSIDDAFAQVQRDLAGRDERDILLTDSGDLADFRRLYPFSPALVEALVALSGAMQRERTALKVMLQLLVDGRDHLQLGQLIPLGDLWDAVDSNDEPLTEVMRSQFSQARRLWTQRFQPMLLRDHHLDEEAARHLDPTHGYVTDARLVKSLLVAALVPGVGVLRELTVSRLTALNAGVVRAFVPGTERQQVLDRLRRWQAEIGELRVGDDERDPTVAVVLTGIDTGPILEAARVADSFGERKRLIRNLLVEALQVRDADSLDPFVEVVWRGTRRRLDVVFGNVRDRIDLPDEVLRASADPKLVIDFPMDDAEGTATDDRGRVQDYLASHSAEWTAAWLPNFLTAQSQDLLAKLVRLDHALKDGVWENVASYLTPGDRATARSQLASELHGLRERLGAILRQAYRIDPAQEDNVGDDLPASDQFLSLDPSLRLQAPVATGFRGGVEGLADQLLASRFPRHPEFTELVSRAELTHTLEQVSAALGQDGGRLENVPSPLRRTLLKVAEPLALGKMYQAHFVADLNSWIDVVERHRGEAGSTVTVGQVRRWLDAADTPEKRRGLTREIGDLLILLVALATNRALISGGRAVTAPELGKLRDDWELRAEELPAPELWSEALRRAAEIGIVAGSRQRTAAGVADLGQRILALVAGDGAKHVQDLVPALEAAGRRLGLAGAGPRLETARAAAELVAELRRRPDHAPSVLAAARIPSTVAALGTSISQTASIRDELERVNWQLLQGAMGLRGERATEAALLRERLVAALDADELTTPLVARLRAATRAATDLLTPPRPPDPPAGGSVAVSGAVPGPAQPSFGRDEAEVLLEGIRHRLRSAGLDLTWEIVDLADGGA